MIRRFTRTRVAVGVLALTFAITGCSAEGADSPPDDAPAPSAAAPGGDDAVDTDPDDASAGDDGGAGETPSAVPLPDNWPAEVPVIPGTIVDAVYVPGDSVTFWGLRVLPDVALEVADDEALSIMAGAGFVVAGGRENDDGSINRQFQNENVIVVINISFEPGEDGVLYNVRPR